MGMKMKENLYQVILWIILLIIAGTMVLPFLYVIMVSFTDSSVYVAGSFYLWPKKWSTEAYQLILSGAGFLNALMYWCAPVWRTCSQNRYRARNFSINM